MSLNKFFIWLGEPITKSINKEIFVESRSISHDAEITLGNILIKKWVNFKIIYIDNAFHPPQCSTPFLINFSEFGVEKRIVYK